MKFILLTILFAAATVCAQIEKASELPCDKRAAAIADSLDERNPLRVYIKGGLRGRCIEQPWMAKMRKLGVKHAWFLFDAKWDGREHRITIVKADYLDSYYPVQGGEIDDPKRLSEIKKSGLASDLEAVVVQNARSLFDIPPTGGEGPIGWGQLNLFDDPALPSVAQMGH